MNLKYLIAFIIGFALLSNYASAQTVVNTTTNSKSDVESKGRTIVISPPPSAISPSVNSSSSDLCTVGVAGAVQTQILGISTGETIRDPNCECRFRVCNKIRCKCDWQDSNKAYHATRLLSFLFGSEKCSHCGENRCIKKIASYKKNKKQRNLREFNDRHTPKISNG